MRILLSVLSAFFYSIKAFANPACPVCMVTVGASLYLAEKSGLDKCVIGVWSGALLAIFGYFLIRYFNKKNWNFPARDFILMTLSVSSVSFIYFGQLNYDPVIIWFLFIDTFLLSNLCGALIFIFGINFYSWLKEKNGGRAHFPFEKVFIPVLFTGILSTIFYFYPLCDCATRIPDLNDNKISQTDEIDLIPVLE